MNNKSHNLSENECFQAFAPQFSILPPSFSPNGAFSHNYSPIGPQNVPKKVYSMDSSSYILPEFPMWDNFKLPLEKISDSIDKDLTPSSCLVNMESFSSPMDKSGAQRYNSCAQMSKFYMHSNNSANYYSHDKMCMDKEQTFKSCAFYNSNVPLEHHTQNTYMSCPGLYSPQFTEQESTNAFYSTNFMSDTTLPCRDSSELFNLVSDTSTADHQTEVSNEDEEDDSDIVVEDSSSECSEQLSYSSMKCLVCNIEYSLFGLQFYALTNENPLTMSSQVPVKSKISKFLPNSKVFTSKDYLCNDCLGLVNTIDHLQVKLDSLINSFKEKVKVLTTDNDNNNEVTRKKFKRKFQKFKCKKCKKVLCMRQYMARHVHIHQVRLLCELCGKTSNTLKQLKTHLNVHKRKTAKFQCSSESCRKKFKTKHHLKEHENYCLGTLPFKCTHSHCTKKFPSATRLKNHVKLKHEKKFTAICSICNIGFVKTSDYKSHMTSHGTDKKFICLKCNRAYKTLSNLNFHLKSHQNSLPFKCEICDKGFMRKEYHEAHVNNHKGIKSFSCTICEKKFVTQKNLDAHMKYHEGNVKGHLCNVCKKVVTSCFEEHLRVHANLREFECDQCHFRFNTKNSLSKHKKRKHDKINS
ncbi:hypothetical protein ABEB36_000352 [Hypothenemus hampei]|uniref:C2H2-type domain-containing protein n=1 Tax=Hypothenemus hampei TaxID=57062 RepID=A0ABD1FAX2_HYPHA